MGRIYLECSEEKGRTRAPHGTPVCGLRITCGGLCRLHEVALRSATDAGNVIHAHVLEHLRVERLAQLLHTVELLAGRDLEH